MAYAGQQFQYEAMLIEERLDTPLICGCCFSAGIYCDFHGSAYPDLPSQPSTTQLDSSFDDDEAWTTNDSGSSLDFYQYSSSSSVHDFGQASTDTSSVSEERSSSSSEDEKFLHRSKPCRQDVLHEQKYPSSLRSWGQISQNCNESLSVEALPTNEAHNQFISPAMLISANQTVIDHEAKPKKRQRTQEKPEMVQPYRNTNADIQSAEPTRINLLDPQILLTTQSSENQALLHELLGIYAEFTSPLNPQSLQAFEGLAALLNRLVKDWLHKPSHLECLKDGDGIPIPPAARDPCSPFACVCGCGYTSPRLIDLERHLSQNWLASYWQCPLCDKRFDRRDMLSAHLRSKKHSGSGEKINEERDFHRNSCDDDFTKRCGFCGEVCKGFKVFTRHIGKHFRGTSSEPPKSMRDWRDTRDDDDDSNSDDVKGASRTGKPNNNGDPHDRRGGSNGGTRGSSKGGEHDGSKGSGHPRARGTNQGNTRSGHSSTYNSGGSGFRASDSSSTDGSLSLSEIALSFSVRHIRERRKARGLPLRPKKTGKEPHRAPVAENKIDTIEAPILSIQNAFPQVSGPPRRGPQSAEVIFDAAERWKVFRLKYDSSSLRTQNAKAREHSQLRPSLGAPLQPRPHKDKSGSAGTNVKGSDRISKTTDDLATSRPNSEEASHNISILDAKRIIKQRKQPKRRLRDNETVILGASTSPLADIDPFGVSRIFGSSGKPFRRDDFKLNWSEDLSFPSVERKKNASRPPSQCEDTAFKMADNLSFKATASSYRKQESKVQEHVPKYREVLVQPHRESSRRDWLSLSPLHHAGKSSWETSGDFLARLSQSAAPVLSPDAHTTCKRGSTAQAQPDQLQPVPHSRSEDHGKHCRGDLKCPPLHAPSVLDLMAPSPQPAGFTSILPTLAHHFARIGVGEYAACERFVKRHPDILDNGQQPSDPKCPQHRCTTGRHRQQQDFLDIVPETCFAFDGSSPWERTDVEDFPPRSSCLALGEQKAQGHRNEDQNRRSVLGFVPYSDVRGLPRISYIGSSSWTHWFAPTNTHGGNGIADPGFNPIDIQSAVSACSAAALTYTDWGAPSLLTMKKWQNREKHPSDMTVTQMPDMHRALHFAPVDVGFEVSIVFEDCRSSSSQEATSVSKLKQHFFRAHSRPEYTCRCCFKLFRTRSNWLGHAERRLCSIDNLRSRALMAKDRETWKGGSARHVQGVGQMLALYGHFETILGIPNSLYPDVLGHEALSLISTAFDHHDHHGFEVSEGYRISGRVLWAYQSTSLSRSYRTPINSRNAIIVLRSLEADLGVVRIPAYDETSSYRTPMNSLLLADKYERDHNLKDVLKGYLEVLFLSIQQKKNQLDGPFGSALVIVPSSKKRFGIPTNPPVAVG